MPLRDKKTKELRALIEKYERTRAMGAIDADLADDIAWTLEYEHCVTVYACKGVRYRVVAGELERDIKFTRRKRGMDKAEKQARQTEARRQQREQTKRRAA